MTVQFRIVQDDTMDDGASTCTMFINGEAHVVSSTHPEWATITSLLLAGGNTDEQKLIELARPIEVAIKNLVGLSERVSLRGQTLLFDGDPIDSALSEHIIRLVNNEDNEDGAGYKPFVNFLEKLYQNPSEQSREHLYHFLTSNKITIHEDGDFLAYKGVTLEGKSTHSGYGIVNGEIFENALLQNEVGSVVEIPRSMVDDNRNSACSTGLHAGTHRYAKGYGQRLLTVKINPRDVVSVPNDASNQKLRVCRYKVMEIAPVTEYGPTYTVADNTVTGETEDTTEDPEEDLLPTLSGTISPQKLYAIKIPEGFEKDDFRDRVQRMVAVISDLPSGTKFRRFRNKNVTVRNRLAFDAALKALGLNDK